MVFTNALLPPSLGKEIPNSPLPLFCTRRTIIQLSCLEHGTNNTKVMDLIPIQVIQSWTPSSLWVLFNSECSVILILACAEPNYQLVPCKEGVPGLLAEQCLSHQLFPELKMTVTDTKENQSCTIHSPELKYCSPSAKSLWIYFLQDNSSGLPFQKGLEHKENFSQHGTFFLFIHQLQRGN